MLNELKQKALQEIRETKDLKTLQEVYRNYLGRKGQLTAVLRSLKDCSEKERRQKGKIANQVKKEIEAAIKAKSKKLQASSFKFQEEWIDVTAPASQPPLGHLHPITQVQRQIEEIFQSLGFSIVEGPEIETEYYNFDALNIPPDHPARDLWDTFWLGQNEGKRKTLLAGRQEEKGKKKERLLLRTHTSPVQIRYMEKHNPPLRIIAPGRCFRHEATDASHDLQFYQVEGLMVDRNVSVADFKGLVEQFFKRLFNPRIRIRLRPSYFPFVEPGFEVDLMLPPDKSKTDSPQSIKDSGWLEIMGAGMVHPNVFKAVKYNPRFWQGFAFGLGLDRIAMMKYKINDIRLFYSGDLRFLRQF